MQQTYSFLALLLTLGLTSANPILPPNPNSTPQPQQPAAGPDTMVKTVVPGPLAPPQVMNSTAPATPKGPPTVRDASDICKSQGQEVYCCAQDPIAVHSGAKMTCNVILFHKPEISAMLIGTVCPTVPSCCFRTKENNAITGCSKTYFMPVIEPVVSH